MKSIWEKETGKKKINQKEVKRKMTGKSNLAKLFVKIRGSSRSRGVCFGVVHFFVVVYEDCLAKLHDFD